MLISPVGVLSRGLVSLPKPSGGAAYFLHLGVHFSAAATGSKTGRRFHLRPWGATYAFSQLAQAVGISTKRLHDARHRAATTMLVAGVDARSVAGMLGHTSAVTTLSIYSHLLEGLMIAAAEHLGVALERAADGRREK